MSLSTNLLDILSSENKIFVAFSGGIDSTALLFLCYKALKQKKIGNLKAIHINHNLSKNSDYWQQHCESFCKSNNIKFSIISSIFCSTTLYISFNNSPNFACEWGSYLCCIELAL